MGRQRGINRNREGEIMRGRSEEREKKKFECSS